MSRTGIILRLCCIVAAGLGIRIGVALTSPAISRDTCRFVWYAQSLQTSALDTLSRENQHPLYPVLIAAAHVVTGPMFADPVTGWQAAAQAVAMVAGVTTALAMFWLGVQLFDRRVALLAALFAVVLPEAVQYSADGLSDLPHACFLLLSLSAGVAAIRTARSSMWALSGLFGGLAYLVRPEGLEAVLVVGAMTCAGRLGIPWRRRLVGAATLLVAAALVCSPYMVLTGKLVHKKSVRQLFGVPGENTPQPDSTPPEPISSGADQPDVEPIMASALPVTVAKAGWEILRNWVRTARVVYVLLAGLACFGASRPVADRVAQRCILGAWLLHFVVLVALVINFDYWGDLSKRHTLLLVLLILPYSAAGTFRLIDAMTARLGSAGRKKLIPTLVVLAVVGSTAYWMLRPVNPDTEYLVRAGRWIRQYCKETFPDKPESAILLTADNRIPFYGGVRMQNWPDRTGSIGILEDHLRDFTPDLVAIDEYRVLPANPDFMQELQERLVRAGRLEVLHQETPTGPRPTRLWIYRVPEPRVQPSKRNSPWTSEYFAGIRE